MIGSMERNEENCRSLSRARVTTIHKYILVLVHLRTFRLLKLNDLLLEIEFEVALFVVECTRKKFPLPTTIVILTIDRDRFLRKTFGNILRPPSQFNSSLFTNIPFNVALIVLSSPIIYLSFLFCFY